MNLNSINIFGITGGIGKSFFDQIKDERIKISGFYNNNVKLASEIAISNPHVTLRKIDLSDIIALKNMKVPNYEGLLYVVGRTHFGKNFFDFNERDVFLQINLNISALLIILNKIISNENCSLKRFVIVSSFYPDKIHSLYHAVKSLQDRLLEILKDQLNARGLGLSIIKTGWVDTGMHKMYQEQTGVTAKKIVSPDVIAHLCAKEFEETKLYSIKKCIQ